MRFTHFIVVALALALFAQTVRSEELNVKVEPAFPDIKWADWEPVSDDGRVEPLRPIVVTNAGDGSNRVFMATQHGVIHVFENDQAVKESKIFLNIRDRVRYYDKENEEGFLGLAFHPKYKENGQLYIYYTVADPPHRCYVSRFTVSKDDPNKVDPKSEVRLLSVDSPYWNHKGGTLAFGPDGYLYIAVGDGGSKADPHSNGQGLHTLLGKILRIDVDHPSAEYKYGIPKDNPFVGEKNALPEVYAYGLRNVWRMAFDPETKVLWAADVGQDLWEEIDLIVPGGNYGWSAREGTQPFKPERAAQSAKFIDPIFEYDHKVGKSITGGAVYRGKRVPELVGKYVYADYVTGKLWALDYDLEAKKVKANYAIKSPNVLPIITFGEDQDRELYFTIVANNGKGIFRFSPGK